LFGYFAIFLAGQFFPREDPVAALLATFAIFAVGFFARPIGGVVFGHIGDRLGRRTALATSLLLMTVATVAFGFLPTYRSIGVLAPILLLLCRILQGLSASAEIPGAQLLILEHTPTRHRGRAVALNNAAGSLGTAAAASVALVLVKTLSPDQMAGWGWRVAFLLAAPIGLVGVYVRRRLLEPAEFAALDASARRSFVPLSRALRTARSGMTVVALWSAATLLAGYLLGGFLPTYLIRTAHLAPDDAFTATVSTILISTLTMVAGGYLIDRYPLRRLALTVMTGLAVVAVPGLLIIISVQTLGAALIGQGLWALFIGPAYTIGAMISISLFPVAIRFTATAVAVNTGVSLFAGTAPYVSTWLVATTHSPLAPGFYLLVVALAGILAVALGLPKTRTPQPDRPAEPLPVDHRVDPARPEA
jgi:MFS transporter, MHS family, proline/betaine transporter